MSIPLKVQCPHCSSDFSRNSSMRRHIRKHLEESHSVDAQNQPYLCGSCDKRFSRLDARNRHELNHEGKGTKKCPQCQRSFRNDYIRKHQRSCRQKKGVHIFKVPTEPTNGSHRLVVELPEGHMDSLDFQARDDGSTSEHAPPTVELERSTQKASPAADDCSRDSRMTAKDVSQLIHSFQPTSTYDTEHQDFIRAANSRDFTTLRAMTADRGQNFAAIQEEWRKSMVQLQDRNDSHRLAQMIGFPLHHSAAKSNLQMIRFHLSHGADINRLDVYGSSPLCVAASFGQLQSVSLLLQSGASVDGGLGARKLPLCAAIRLHDFYTSNFLVSRGASVELREPATSQTPLVCAINEKSFSLTKMLLDCGASALIIDQFGEGPLYHAVETNDATIVQLLLDAGAWATMYTQSKRSRLDSISRAALMSNTLIHETLMKPQNFRIPPAFRLDLPSD